MYSKSAEGRKVLQYVDAQRTTANPLILSSFETSGTSANSEKTELFPMLEAFLGPRGSAALVSSDWATYKNVMLNTVIPIPAVVATQPQASVDATFAVSDQLESELCATQADTYVFPDSPGIWCLVVKGLRSSADNKLLNHYTRDVAAPPNFKWLDDHLYSGHKIVIWAHYAHLGRGTQSPFAGGSVNMGSLLDAMYGKQIYVVAFTLSSGRELAWWEGARASGGGFTTDAVMSSPIFQTALKLCSMDGEPNLFVDARLSPPPASIANLQAKVDDFALCRFTGICPEYVVGHYLRRLVLYRNKQSGDDQSLIHAGFTNMCELLGNARARHIMPKAVRVVPARAAAQRAAAE